MSGYTVYRSNEKILADGRISGAAWDAAPWSDRFVDLITGAPAIFDTRVKCLWDDENLYIAFRAEEPFVTGELTERDAIIFQENDLEIFLGDGDTYYELEVNALNTVYEVFYIWRDAFVKNGWHKRPEFDLLATEARTFGGNHDRDTDYFWTGNHPRGDKFAFIHWDYPGLKTAFNVEGTINDNTDIDKAWTLEIVLPGKGMADLSNGRPVPPRDGDPWKIGFYRFEQLRNAGKNVGCGWGLDMVGDNCNHKPEKFSDVVFSETFVEDL